ncbi:MAG: PqqD family protein [Deltaproteobacteria bacterium]
MVRKVDLESVYAPSQEIVAREIAGEFVIIPVAAGIGDLEDEMFSLNETGRAVWDNLDGKKRLKQVVESLSKKFDGPVKTIEKDVLGLMTELLKRKIIVEV